MSTAYDRDDDGKFIPASQRPDGTWRKARRVKDGYVPQEEVPLYESKGRQFTRKPVDTSLPVGMCPLIAKAAQEQRAKQQQKQQQKAAAAAATASSSSTSAAASATKKPAKKPTASKAAAAQKTTAPKAASTASAPAATSTAAVSTVTQSLDALRLTGDEEQQKQLKKLRKKIREIEAIEEKLHSGDLKQPEQDQLDKVARKPEILRQIGQLEAAVAAL